MTLRDKPAFKRALTTLAQVHGRELTLEVLDAYFGAMRTVELHAAERAIKRAIQDSAFWPKPAELRELAQVASRFVPPAEVDGVPVFRCADCRDIGLVYRRAAAQGVDLGLFCSPCSCGTGRREAEAWEEPGSQGQSFADSARANGARLRRLDASFGAMGRL